MTSPPTTPHSLWREWLAQNAFLCAWLVVGLISITKELRIPSSEISRRRCQFILCWWLTALGTRLVFDVSRLRQSSLIDAWDALLLLPTVLIAVMGIKSIVLRNVELAIEGMLVVSTIGLFVWRVTHSTWAGISAFTLAFVVIALLPTITPMILGGARRWTERDWKRLMRAAVVMILAGHLSAGLIELPKPSAESVALTELRKRIVPVDGMPRVTLITPDGNAPESLLFVLRSRWPASAFALATPGEGAFVRGTEAPREELVIEWTRQEMRIRNELPIDRQATSIGDPVRFRGRRLLMTQVGPRQR